MARVGATFLLLLFVGGALALMALWLWTLVDCATKEPSEGNDKLVWVLIILLTNWIGAIIYLIVRRPERIRKHGR